MAMGRARTAHQARRATRLITAQQFVTRLAADSEARTDHRHRKITLETLRYEPKLLVHCTAFLPWHRQSPPLPNRKTVNDLSGPICQVSIRFRPPKAPSPQPSPPFGWRGRTEVAALLPLS